MSNEQPMSVVVEYQIRKENTTANEWLAGTCCVDRGSG